MILLNPQSLQVIKFPSFELHVFIIRSSDPQGSCFESSNPGSCRIIGSFRATPPRQKHLRPSPAQSSLPSWTLPLGDRESIKKSSKIQPNFQPIFHGFGVPSGLKFPPKFTPNQQKARLRSSFGKIHKKISFYG